MVALPAIQQERRRRDSRTLIASRVKSIGPPGWQGGGAGNERNGGDDAGNALIPPPGVTKNPSRHIVLRLHARMWGRRSATPPPFGSRCGGLALWIQRSFRMHVSEGFLHLSTSIRDYAKWTPSVGILRNSSYRTPRFPKETRTSRSRWLHAGA